MSRSSPRSRATRCGRRRRSRSSGCRTGSTISPPALGREQQRVAVARAIVKRPDALLCDEPTGALDVETGKLVLSAIARANREVGATTVVITHNAAIAGMADRVLRMGGGRIVAIDRNSRRLAPEELVW